MDDFDLYFPKRAFSVIGQIFDKILLVEQIFDEILLVNMDLLLCYIIK